MSNDGRTPDGRWAVPVRRVFPWWYLGGAVATSGVLLLLEPDRSPSMLLFWGPAIGIAIREREKDARARLDEGLPVDRASLLGAAWVEPACAALLAAAAIGIGLLLSALLAERVNATTWLGAGLLAGAAVGFLALIGVLRFRRRWSGRT